MPTLDEVLISKGGEYAPFDTTRVHRIYKQIAPLCGLDEYLGKSCKIIHIMGTNGKGSTGRFIAMGLAQNGKRALHFSSPHIFGFNERFYLATPDSQNDISFSALEAAHQHLWSIESVREASYFEYATFLALFLAKDYEYLVLEAGVGGEYDSTSVIGANTSVYTLIGLDHQEMLGNSIEEIALTKLRAMSGRVIVAKQQYEIVEQLALQMAQQKALQCDVWQMDYKRHLDDDLKGFEKYIKTYSLPAFLCDNLHTAIRTLAFFGIKFDFSTLKPLSLRGRCEALTPHITLDVGHNIDGARVIREYFREKRVNLVYNSYLQKDIEAILRTLLPIIKEVLILSVEHSRICPKESLIKTLEALAIQYEDFDVGQMKENEDYLVFGSFSVVETFLQLYKGT
ncbi:bifunctional folylpolyglutamate synthase/dihydrofolate synthase [uncultured Helicobacter sp.]|uniref:bifunctional folylpolyglutamate synthase/dihydrofolate synthase n=1 Tax=uncultured Helicobacter sp. TaxID=175537 RepID=UPI00260CA7E2|nr:bifunctional folylpolyglutamate synthase/dihydrofolate synthase [uncultured Helicobacter sp.]